LPGVGQPSRARLAQPAGDALLSEAKSLGERSSKPRGSASPSEVAGCALGGRDTSRSRYPVMRCPTCRLGRSHGGRTVRSPSPPGQDRGLTIRDPNRSTAPKGVRTRGCGLAQPVSWLSPLCGRLRGDRHPSRGADSSCARHAARTTDVRCLPIRENVSLVEREEGATCNACAGRGHHAGCEAFSR
jgi:hypothetical protein